MADPHQAESRSSTWLLDGPVRAMRWWWQATWSKAPLGRDEQRLERRLGWARVLGGLAILTSLWGSPTPAPSWVGALTAGSAIGLLVAGLVAILVVPRVVRPRRLLEALSLAEAGLFAMLLPFGAAQDNPFVILVLSISAIAGGLRLGRFGVLRNLAIAAPFETIRLVLGASLFDNQFIEDTVIAVVVSYALGLLVADVATAGRRATARAEAVTMAAQGDRMRARRRRWEAEVVDDIVRTAGAGDVREALVAALGRVRTHLRLADVHLLLAGTGHRMDVWWSSDPALPPGTGVPLLPGGPHDRALSLGTVAAATHDDLDRLADDGTPRAGSIVAAPLPVGGHLLGLVVAATPPADLLHRRDVVVVAGIGRALAPFVWAATTAADGVVLPDPAGTGPDGPTDDASPGPGRPPTPGQSAGAGPPASSGEQRVHEGVGIEDREVVDPLAEADQLHR